ncbi:MAG: tRNA pseudouridine(38-40) synthase TruA [Anaerostipes sp.]|nr:tRNA pseudouridine(38-40) synthase TruA [Anaerostipes sp.]
MQNIKFIIEYDGTRYKGWQKLGKTSNGDTIQGKFETILKKLTGEDIQVIGSGRTDAKVHALCQVANFHTNSKLSPNEIMNYVNEYLPADIAVTSAVNVSERFHSRLNAKDKTYRYHIISGKKADVFRRNYVWHIEEPLDLKAMRQASTLLLGTHDFKGFSSIKKTKKSTTRTISNISIVETKKEIQISYTGNGFLYHMIRILTGTLVEIGKGDRTPDSILTVFHSQNRQDAGITAPPQGLFLVDVTY